MKENESWVVSVESDGLVVYLKDQATRPLHDDQRREARRTAARQMRCFLHDYGTIGWEEHHLSSLACFHFMGSA